MTVVAYRDELLDEQYPDILSDSVKVINYSADVESFNENVSCDSWTVLLAYVLICCIIYMKERGCKTTHYKTRQ